MFLNIITPCTRPENLKQISESINIPRENYRWIVVFDAESIPEDIPDNCEPYAIKVKDSVFGNGQRNYGLSLIKNGHVYFNDDDTTIHPLLWDNIRELSEDFIYFKQNHKSGKIRITGDTVGRGFINSHTFIISYNCIGITKWVINNYEADGIFGEECYNKSKTKILIPEVLSIYNSLN